jgi:hypothetical protein
MRNFLKKNSLLSSSHVIRFQNGTYRIFPIVVVMAAIDSYVNIVTPVLLNKKTVLKKYTIHV